MKPDDLTNFEHLTYSAYSSVSYASIVNHLEKNEKFYKKMFKQGSADFYYLEVYIRYLEQEEQDYFWQLWSEATTNFKQKKLSFQKTRGVESKRKLFCTMMIVLFVLIGFILFKAFFLKDASKPHTIQVDSTYYQLPKRIGSNPYWNYTKEDFPRFYLLWGKEGVNKISALERLVVQEVANTPSYCDEIAIVGLMESRSIPKKHMVFFVDCENGTRLYVDENQLPNLSEEEMDNILKNDENYNHNVIKKESAVAVLSESN